MKHTLSGLTGVLLLSAAGFIAMSARAQEPAASEAKQTTAQEAAASEANPIEPAATEALEKMGAYLRSLKSFQVTSEGTSEVVLDDGQKEQFARTANIVARTPDRLMVQISGDQGSKAYFYDGKTFTLFSPDDNYYATVPAPAICGNSPRCWTRNTMWKFRSPICSCGARKTPLRRKSPLAWTWDLAK